MQHTTEELADVIFPDVHETLADLDKKYPPRNLPEGAEVTRFAPSPTGFLHTGSLFTALIAYTVAKRSQGVYFFRLEDTDQKREVEGTGEQLVDQLAFFGIKQDEGYMGDNRPEKGIYGPYVQSHRKEIYDVVIKEMIRRGRAYPCFCTEAELDELRKVQEANKVVPGYYGNYAKCRFRTVAEDIKLIKEGTPFVIRFRSEGDHTKFFQVKDLVRGTLSLPENDQDIVIRKSDGLPTYHFAHLVDDHYMGTTVVTRGEEWLSSLPIHIELFEAIGWKAPKYAHLPVIMVNDPQTGNRRKLSKRKDKEAAVSYFIQEGYPRLGILKYLMTISNSNFEEWLRSNPRKPLLDFPFTFAKMSREGALFDLPKLTDISQNELAYESAKEISSEASEWADKFSPELANFIKADPERFEAIMNIERDQPKPRKDYSRYSDIYPKVRFFDSEEFAKFPKPFPFDPKLRKEDIKAILEGFSKYTGLEKPADQWFGTVQELGAKLGFAKSFKEYKADPAGFKGFAGDVASVIRVAETGSKNSPSLYYVLKILGDEESKRRALAALEAL